MWGELCAQDLVHAFQMQDLSSAYTDSVRFLRAAEEEKSSCAALYLLLEHLYCAIEAFSHVAVQDLNLTQPQALVDIFGWVFCYQDFDGFNVICNSLQLLCKKFHGGHV